MKPDYKLNNYYDMFINEAKLSIKEHKDKYDLSVKLRDNCYEYINLHKDTLKEIGININEYQSEWVDKKYDDNELLFKEAQKLLKKYEEGPNRVLILQIIKYCSALKYCRIHFNNFLLAGNNFKLGFKQFKAIVNRYYSTVHKAILEGYAYSYGYGIGDLFIARWKVGELVRPKIDYMATNKKREQFRKEGKELYDPCKAAWYKARGIKYEVEDYRVYCTNEYIYEFLINNSKLLTNSKQEFNRTEYINSAIRGHTHEEFAEMYKTKEEIFYAPFDMRVKLNVLLINYPNEYLKFIRNVEQCKYKRGAHNSKNRQRLQSR